MNTSIAYVTNVLRVAYSAFNIVLWVFVFTSFSFSFFFLVLWLVDALSLAFPMLEQIVSVFGEAFLFAHDDVLRPFTLDDTIKNVCVRKKSASLNGMRMQSSVA